jgi:tetratricopeptide (TPR) repeat protein
MKTAMISSTARDLPEHRNMVMDACLRQGFQPIMMDHLAAQDRSANDVSIGMVEDADVYLGIFAFAYGSSPDDDERSYTEIEFDKAVSLVITVIPFFADENTPWPPRLVDTGEKAARLERLKQKATKDRIVSKFKSPEDLRGLVIHALGEFEKTQKKTDAPAKLDLHPPNIIPQAPKPYIAHPYSLLQTSQVVGRQTELNLLTDWVTANKAVPPNVRLFNLIAIGGMGKSALTWKWFNDIAPHELPNRAGWMWWSFYESDAHYENFIIRALAYCSGQPGKTIRELKQLEREDQLWRLLDEQPFVLVLDGLERILLAYSRMDAARMLDDDLDERTANFVARAGGLPESAGQSFIGKHQLRLTADQRAGRFLRRLASIHASRILISTRLYPAELQTETGDPLPGCSATFLQGLSDDDALNLWREFKVSGSREQLLKVFHSFGNYPLLTRALAGEVAGYRPAPRDFDRWREDNPNFNPAQLDLKNAKTHVLEYALRGLGEIQRKVLHTLAAFRMPAIWDTLRALLVGTNKPCADDQALDAILTEVEDRGLMGWDRQANRYDLHPIVRAVVWAALATEAKKDIYSELHTYFDAAPRPPDWRGIEYLEELTPAIELFDKLIGLEQFDDAASVFEDHLEMATLHRLSASRLRVELLEQLFPDGLEAPPRTREQSANVLNALGQAYHYGGEPGRAAPFFRRAANIDRSINFTKGLGSRLANLALALWPSGQIHAAEIASLRACELGQQEGLRHLEGFSLVLLGQVFTVLGDTRQAGVALARSSAIFASESNQQAEGFVAAYLAQRLIWSWKPRDAMPMAEKALKLAMVRRLERDVIRAHRLYGEVLSAFGDLAVAEEHLSGSLSRARNVNFIDEELTSLTALAELYRQRNEYESARELLDEVSGHAKRGPYPLLHADAQNVLGRIEIKDNREAAMAAATRAYELAWCDGPPYAYHFGLTNAKQLLAELGAPEPDLPPFDESKFEPMPDVEINPKDEFWVDPAIIDSGLLRKPKRKPRHGPKRRKTV